MTDRLTLVNDGDGMTNIEMYNEAHKLGLPNFKYFMSDKLVTTSPSGKKECGIVNLDDSDGAGTHHICYWIDFNTNEKYCFDSFGVAPPTELIDYLSKASTLSRAGAHKKILYSTYVIQDINDTNCSELCLYVLNELNKGRDYKTIILELL